MSNSHRNTYNFDIVDVFTQCAGEGNPVAVVHDADGLDELQMQQFASWLGLPETVFVSAEAPPGCDYAVRIFAPARELSFAGHPSIGTLSSLLSRKPAWRDRTNFRQSCPAGEVDLFVKPSSGGAVIEFETPEPAEVVAIANDLKRDWEEAIATGIEAIAGYRVRAGANWIILRFGAERELDRAEPNERRLRALSEEQGVSGVTVVAPSDRPDVSYELRSFAPLIGVSEDAVCGGGNACAAAVLGLGAKHISYEASQGRHLNRRGRVFASGPYGERRFRIGGYSVVVISGAIQAALSPRDRAPRTELSNRVEPS